ncbi:MAG: methyltransferase domain-containing protein [Rhizobiales bacterium]|nr:methyltransferase domain-containing protein [Hyphomicrobiales bacterium]
MDHSAAEEKSVTLLEDDEFRAALRKWFEGFHAHVRSMSEEDIRLRINSYLRQEEQYREKVRFILHTLSDRGARPQTALDIGSSAGGLSVALAQAGLTVDGVEPSAAGVTAAELRAKRCGVAAASFQVGIGEALPFPDGRFDLVVSVAVLEHVQDPQAVVRETFRVLRPGGHAMFEVPNYLFPFEPHYKIAWLPMMPKPLGKLYASARGGNPDFLDELNYTNAWNVRRLFDRAGFVEMRDLYASYLAGKAEQAPWAGRGGRLARMPWSAGLIRTLLSAGPGAWFLNRAVYLLARKSPR